MEEETTVGKATWVIDRNVEPSEIVGPCGCRYPNTPQGHAIAKKHRHLDEEKTNG